MRGQSLIEFAISLVVLLILVSVIVDAARSLFTYLSLRDAAQEGAIYASYQPYNNSGIQSRICGASNYLCNLCGGIFEDQVCKGINAVNEVLGDIKIKPEATVVVVGKNTLCFGKTGSNTHGISIKVEYPEFPLTMPFVGAFLNSQTVSISAQVTSAILSPVCP